MSRIPIPASIGATPPASHALLETINAQFGQVPNLFRLIAHSPAALEGYLALVRSLQKGSLSARTRERIALAMAEFNGCTYCLSAHAWFATHQARLDEAEIAANRHGTSNDAKAAAAVKFALRVARARGHVAEADVDAVRAAGYGEAEVVEIILHVAMNCWTNYINEVAGTDIDFPRVPAWTEPKSSA